MPLPESDLRQLRAIVKKWGDIQAEIKRAEQISRLSVGPSINELRYAGRILVSALAQELDHTPIEFSESEEELDHSQSLSTRIAIADQYLTNAENDISDSLFYFFQKRADDINRAYGASAVEEKRPGYMNFLEDLEKSRQLIIESRRDLSKRPENYEKLKPLREKLIASYFDLQKSDAMMAIEVHKHERETKRYKIKTKRYKILSIALAAALVLALTLHFR